MPIKGEGRGLKTYWDKCGAKPASSDQTVTIGVQRMWIQFPPDAFLSRAGRVEYTWYSAVSKRPTAVSLQSYSIIFEVVPNTNPKFE